MKSENYRQLLNNDRDSLEMTSAEFDNTLMHFAMLYHKEKCGNKEVIDHIPDARKKVSEKEQENLVKKLNIQRFSNRSEQLNSFDEWFNKEWYPEEYSHLAIKEYLKTI